MGCGGGGQPASTKQELDPAMQKLLYGGEGKVGLYDQAAQLFLNRTPEQSVAGFNPLQRYAMEQTARQALTPHASMGAMGDVASKLLARGGVKYAPQQMEMPQFDISQLFGGGQAGQGSAPSMGAPIQSLPAILAAQNQQAQNQYAAQQAAEAQAAEAARLKKFENPYSYGGYMSAIQSGGHR